MVTRKNGHPEGCRIERCKHFTTLRLDITTGARVVEMTYWRAEPCGRHLLDAREQEAGACNVCRDGWTHEENFPTERGLQQLARLHMRGRVEA